jgi:hypothetical protein
MGIAARLDILGWSELARIFELPASEIDPALARHWHECVRAGDPETLTRMASLWVTRQVLARLACAAVRLVAHDAVTLRLVNLVERWADGLAPITAVWDAARDANAAGAFLAAEAAGAVGDSERDDAYHEAEAIDAAARAVRSVVARAPERVHEVRALVGDIVPPPSQRNVEIGYARWSDDE